MKNILLFGAGKSATVLIDYLLGEAPANEWSIIIADASLEQILLKTHNSPFARAEQIDITNEYRRSELITGATIVISMMPPALHFLIARDCVAYEKSLLTASYLDDQIKSLQPEVENKGLLFLCEMGLDPGIDHMSAMKIIDAIKAQNGNITSFKSHCGGLIAPESDNNPWHYKISWNPRNVVNAGKGGATYKKNNLILHKDHKEIFANCPEVNVEGVGKLAIYPNRDSLNYLPVYKLENAATFERTTLRYPSFCLGWNAIVQAGLVNDINIDNIGELTFAKWSAPVLPFVNDQNSSLLGFLGLFDDSPVPSSAKTSADILQYLLETRLSMQPDDRDMIVMLHQIEYEYAGATKKIESGLIVKGEDHLRTAMAKTVGLPLGVAVKLILNGTIMLTGIHTPTLKEIYEPVLAELQTAGIHFTEREL